MAKKLLSGAALSWSAKHAIRAKAPRLTKSLGEADH
jgi:hypothetical protein